MPGALLFGGKFVSQGDLGQQIRDRIAARNAIDHEAAAQKDKRRFARDFYQPYPLGKLHILSTEDKMKCGDALAAEWKTTAPKGRWSNVY